MQNFDLHKYLGNNPLLEDENSNSEDFLDSLTEEQLQEATAWENIKFALSKLGRYKAGGKIRGKKELDKKEIARIEALLDKSANNQIKNIKKTIDKEFEGFPNNKEQNVFIDGVLEIAKVYDSIKAETESGKIPVDAGNAFIEELKEYVKDILDRQLKAVYSVTNENQELEEKVDIDPDANPKDIATLKFKPVKDAIKSGELTPYETERIKTLKSWSLPLKLVLSALSAAGLGWLFDAVSGGEEEVTVETLKKFSEVVGEIKPGEGMTQVFNRVYDTSFDINSDPQELADFIKNTIGGGSTETAINNLTNNGAEGVGGLFTEGDEAKETLEAFMADPDGKGDTLKDVFNGDWTGDGKTATDTLDTLTGNKLVGIVTKIVVKTVIISTAKYTLAKSVLGGIGAGLAIGAAAVAISRYKGRKSSRAQVLNDLFQYLRPIEPTKENPEILDVKVVEPKKTVKTKTVVSKPSKANFDNVNRNNQIATILGQINPKLDIYDKLESEGIKSELVSDLKDIRDNEEASKELKDLAILILSIRKNPSIFLDKVSKATGIKFDTRAKAKMLGGGKKGKSAAKLGLAESVFTSIKEGVVADRIEQAISDSDIASKRDEVIALLGSMYKSSTQKDGKRLSVLNIDELKPDELEKLKGLGFSTKDKSGRYVFMDSEEEVSLEKDDKGDSKKVSSRIKRVGNYLDKKPNLKRKFKLIDRNVEVAPIILALFLALPDKFKKKSIILKMISKMIQDDRLKTLDNKEEVKEATNRKATQDVINALDIFDDYDQLKVSLSALLKQSEVIDVFFDEFLPEMPGITRGELEYALKQIKMELNNVKGEDAKDIESAFSGLGITQKGEKEKEIEIPTWSASQEVNYTLTKEHLKKIIKEALTPDEAAKVEPKYKETYAAMIKGKGPLKLKKYDNPDKVVRGRVVNTIKNESLKIAEKLGKTADVGDYKDDFRKSDAPQFKGKSKKKRDQMATAAFLNREEQKLDEIDAMMEDAKDKSEENYSNYFKKMNKNRLNEFVKAALMGPINETLDDKVYDLVDRMLDAMGGSDNLLEELIRAMSTKDAMFYLSAIARDYGVFDDAEELDESNAYIMAADEARDAGKKEFEFPEGSGKMHPVKIKANIDEAEVNEMKMMDFAKEIKTASSPENFLKAIKKIFPSDSMRPGDDFIKNMFTQLKPELSESFKSLSKDIDKQKGKTKEDGDNIAGYIANIKRQGGGKGPTAKQKKRMAEYILKELRK